MTMTFKLDPERVRVTVNYIANTRSFPL